MKFSISLFYIYFVMFFWIVSCVDIARKNKNITLSLIDDFLKKSVEVEKIKKILGEPSRIMKLKEVPETIYIYNNKKNNLREWNFGIDKKERVVWINHKPWSNPFLDRVEILPGTWKKYNCKKKIEPNKSVPHVIQEYTFFECAEGKIRAYFNIYGEISNITVNR